MQNEHKSGAGVFLRSPSGIALMVFLAIGAFFLVTEHTAHTFGYLPYALLLLCPLMHLFMHGGHGGGGHGDHGGERTPDTRGEPR